MKKKICYVSASSGDWGGASRVLFTNIRLLNRERYEPLILLPDSGPIVDTLEGLGIHYEFWALHEPAGLVSYMRDIIKAYRFLKKQRVDLLHINHADYWRPAEIIAAKLLKIPVVTHYHLVIDQPGPYVRHSSVIVANSNYTAKTSNPKDIPMRVIHCSVELERYDNSVDVRPELGLSSDDIVISFIGQIREIKGIDLFIELARRISDKRAKFLIVGQCRDAEKYSGTYTEERLQEEIGSCAKVKYVGYRADVQNMYCTSDIVVMPSRWEEPFGLINIEAGAAYKPIIASRVGGIPEIVRHGENGFLIEKDDIDSLVGYAQKLIDDQNLRTRMGKRGREIVMEKFTMAPIRKLEGLYDALLEKKISITGD